MKAGDVVKFSAPMNDTEADERYIVREMRGDRVLVELVTTYFSIKPTDVFQVAELEVV